VLQSTAPVDALSAVKRATEIDAEHLARVLGEAGHPDPPAPVDHSAVPVASRRA